MPNFQRLEKPLNTNVLWWFSAILYFISHFNENWLPKENWPTTTRFLYIFRLNGKSTSEDALISRKAFSWTTFVTFLENLAPCWQEYKKYFITYENVASIMYWVRIFRLPHMNESSQKLEAHMVLGLAMVEPFDEGTKKIYKNIHTYLSWLYL